MLWELGTLGHKGEASLACRIASSRIHRAESISNPLNHACAAGSLLTSRPRLHWNPKKVTETHGRSLVISIDLTLGSYWSGLVMALKTHSEITKTMKL